MKRLYYVELDALLDTRLGTLNRFFPENAVRLHHDGYYKRRSDFFEGIDMDQYRAHYKERDTETLSYSRVSNIILLLRELTGKTIEQMSELPFIDGFGFLINAHPYELTKEEADAISSAVVSLIGISVDVEIISLPPERVSPSFCKDLTAMFIYNYEDWLTANVNEFLKDPARNLTVFVPALFVASNPTDEEIQEHIKKIMHPFATLEFTLKSIVDFQMIDVGYFSLIGLEKLDPNPPSSQ